jgi:DNA-binding beta-propeller fold protein YncE
MAGIARIDPATNTVVARIEPGGAVIELAAGFGAIWAIDAFHGRLLRIDPDTNRVTRQHDVGKLPSGIAIGHGSVWVGNQLESTVTRIDPDNGRTLSTFAFQDGAIWPGAITATTDAVWVVTRDGNAVSRINPTTSTVDRLIPLRGARSLTVANGSVWAGVANSASLFRIGPRGLSRVTIPYRANAYGPELAGGDALWLAVPAGVARVSPAGARIPLQPQPLHLSSIVTAAGDTWVADQDGNRVLRLTEVGVVR